MRPQHRVQFVAAQLPVEALLALPLALPGEAYPTCDLLTGFAFPVAQQFFGIDGGDIQMKINSVQ